MSRWLSSNDFHDSDGSWLNKLVSVSIHWMYTEFDGFFQVFIYLFISIKYIITLVSLFSFGVIVTLDIIASHWYEHQSDYDKSGAKPPQSRNCFTKYPASDYRLCKVNRSLLANIQLTISKMRKRQYLNCAYRAAVISCGTGYRGHNRTTALM